MIDKDELERKRQERTLRAAAAIRRLRTALGVSQEELAERMGVSGPAVTQWESGGNRMPWERLPDLAAALGVPDEVVLYEFGLLKEPPRPSLEDIATGRYAERIRAARAEPPEMGITSRLQASITRRRKAGNRDDAPRDPRLRARYAARAALAV